MDLIICFDDQDIYFFEEKHIIIGNFLDVEIKGSCFMIKPPI